MAIRSQRPGGLAFRRVVSPMVNQGNFRIDDQMAVARKVDDHVRLSPRAVFRRIAFLGIVFVSWAQTGSLDEALGALSEVLQTADEHEIRHYEAEANRLKGELLLRQDRSKAAEAQSCFERAIEIARKQSAKSLELRATLSLSQLLDKQGRREEARAMLADIYGWFTEGFDTADLKDAKALLDELSK